MKFIHPPSRFIENLYVFVHFWIKKNSYVRLHNLCKSLAFCTQKKLFCTKETETLPYTVSRGRTFISSTQIFPVWMLILRVKIVFSHCLFLFFIQLGVNLGGFKCMVFSPQNSCSLIFCKSLLDLIMYYMLCFLSDSVCIIIPQLGALKNKSNQPKIRKYDLWPLKL